MLEEAATIPTRLETSASVGPGTGADDGSSGPLGAALLSAALAHAAPYSASGVFTALSSTSDLLAPVAMESRHHECTHCKVVRIRECGSCIDDGYSCACGLHRR